MYLYADMVKGLALVIRRLSRESIQQPSFCLFFFFFCFFFLFFSFFFVRWSKTTHSRKRKLKKRTGKQTNIYLNSPRRSTFSRIDEKMDSVAIHYQAKTMYSRSPDFFRHGRGSSQLFGFPWQDRHPI